MALFGLVGKTVCLLWQLWLMFGPSFHKMRAALSRVRSLCLDYGTESGFPDVMDLLPAFFRYIGAALPENYTILPYLFPRAIMQPGMRHSIDRLIKRTLLSLKWFAEWLDGFKAIVSFIRDRATDISQQLTKDGFPAVADLVKAAKLRPFINWRWGTLKHDVAQVKRFHKSLSQTLRLDSFRKRCKDPVIIRRITKVFSNNEW